MWIVKVALNRPYTFIVVALLILLASPVRPLFFKNRYEIWKQMTADDSQIIFVAECPENGVVGFVNGSSARDEGYEDFAEVWAIYLLQHYHGKKVGLRLLKADFDVCAEKGFSKGYLWVLKNNPTIRFYEKSGGRRGDGVKKDVICGRNIEEHRYV
jgi:GNAT superfamily N-acetyltransferase